MVDKAKFNDILKSYKIKASCINTHNTRSYISYDLVLMPGGKVRDIIRYSDELSLSIRSFTKPTVKVLRKSGVVRVGFAKERDGRLNLFDIAKKSSGLNCTLGEAIDGKLIKMDLTQNPHMIVSGTTGSGKSVLLHNIIYNVLSNCNNTNIVLMDPKNIEFEDYKNKINNVFVRNSFIDCLETLRYLVDVMEYRYNLLSRGVKSKHLPHIVVIIDEFADLIMQDNEDREFYKYLCRLAQKSRAAKINIILATQRPTVDIINGTIKANFPARIACRTSSAVDSRVVLDSKGAENLLGKGDALLKDNTRNLERFQAAYIDSHEICKRFGKSETIR